MTSHIMKMHHTAFRCRDSETTRAFYEDFLNLPLAETLEIGITKTGDRAQYLHTFYKMDDDSFLAFFEAPSMPSEFKKQHDFDLHIALEVERDHMMAVKERADAAGMECRGISDHDFIHSIYLRDPNGYVVELTVKGAHHDEAVDPSKNNAQGKLDNWTKAKRAAGIGPDVDPGFGEVKTGTEAVGTAGEPVD